MPKRIAIIFQEKCPRNLFESYAITQIAQFWQNDGHKVIPLFGTQHYVPADIAILHVDLSIVPTEYIEFAQKYPVTLNTGVKDIRKSVVSDNLLNSNDDYMGPVIVKSDLNFAGRPESIYAAVHGDKFEPTFSHPTSYPIYQNIKDVPDLLFQRNDVVVEKFFPEMKDGLFCVRYYNFLGSLGTCFLLRSDKPIVNGLSKVDSCIIEPHPKIIELQKKHSFDYGKFDYVIHKGKLVLLDTNKTVGGAANLAPGTEMEDARRFRAQGLYEYL